MDELKHERALMARPLQPLVTKVEQLGARLGEGEGAGAGERQAERLTADVEEAPA